MRGTISEAVMKALTCNLNDLAFMLQLRHQCHIYRFDALWYAIVTAEYAAQHAVEAILNTYAYIPLTNMISMANTRVYR